MLLNTEPSWLRSSRTAYKYSTLCISFLSTPVSSFLSTCLLLSLAETLNLINPPTQGGGSVLAIHRSAQNFFADSDAVLKSTPKAHCKALRDVLAHFGAKVAMSRNPVLEQEGSNFFCGLKHNAH